MKNQDVTGAGALASCPFDWKVGGEYRLTIEAAGARIVIKSAGKTLIDFTDKENPWLFGQIGASVRDTSCCHFKDFAISPL